jgi:hypothetical protein
VTGWCGRGAEGSRGRQEKKYGGRNCSHRTLGLKRDSQPEVYNARRRSPHRSETRRHSCAAAAICLTRTGFPRSRRLCLPRPGPCSRAVPPLTSTGRIRSAATLAPTCPRHRAWPPPTRHKTLRSRPPARSNELPPELPMTESGPTA